MASITTVSVSFKDGTETSARIGVREIVEIERHWRGGIVPAFESTFFGAWVALGRPGPEADLDERFDAWLATVEDLSEQEPESADPSPPAVGGD